MERDDGDAPLWEEGEEEGEGGEGGGGGEGGDNPAPWGVTSKGGVARWVWYPVRRGEGHPPGDAPRWSEEEEEEEEGASTAP